MISLLLTTTNITVFDRTAIKKGDLIRARYSAWPQTINGIVAGVNESAVRVLYIGEGGNTSNYFEIEAAELEQGLWDISWSTDLTAVNSTGAAVQVTADDT